MANLKRQVQASGGTVNTLLTDTAMSRQMRQGLTNVEQGTVGFNQSMEALKHNFLFYGYFRRQEKSRPAPPNKPPLRKWYRPASDKFRVVLGLTYRLCRQ